MKNTMTDKDYENIGRLVEDVYISGSANYKKLIWLNFVKGMAYGLGIFIAGTIVIALVIWILSLFDTAPIIGPLVQHVINYLNK